jgi:hypothetical protein
LLDKAFLADPVNHADFAVLIIFFDLPKLTGWDVRGVVGLDDARLQNLRF